MIDTPLRFEPLYQDRIWGARNLGTLMGRSLPEGRRIGESWEIVDRVEAQSVVAEGPYAGRNLRDVIQAAGRDLMGPGYDRERPFPILVKWLDCADRLSLQVHPPASIAPELGGEPKTENWYIAATSAEAQLIVGLKRGVSREAFAQGIETETVEELVHRFPVSAGDSILVESGRLHAIDAGNLILEIQQNSDTTYRVYDWGRVDLDGTPRQLHVEQSMRSIDFEDFEPEPLRVTGEDSTLADCAEFRIRKFVRPVGTGLHLPGEVEPKILSVVSGTLRVDGPQAMMLNRGDNAILPWSGDFQLQAEESATFLLTDHFV